MEVKRGKNEEEGRNLTSHMISVEEIEPLAGNIRAFRGTDTDWQTLTVRIFNMAEVILIHCLSGPKCQRCIDA